MVRTTKLNILYGEGDAEVLASQSAAMQKAGHTVAQAASRKTLQSSLEQASREKKSFDLLILGPTLTRNDRHHLPYMAKKSHPHISVLVLHADGSRHPYVDACTDTGASTETILANIAAFTGMQPSEVEKEAAAAGGR